MAITSNTYTGNGSNKLFSITFPYLDTSDIDVYLNGVLQTITTQYTFANATTVEFVAAPANGAVILLDRSTDDSENRATFFPGSSIKANDLNENFDQTLYVVQELGAQLSNKVNKSGDTMSGNLAMAGNKVTGLGTTSNANDAATKTYVDDNAVIYSGSPTFIQDGTGAVSRSWNSKFKEIISLEDFGAVGDGVADDTAAITLAFAAASGTGTAILGTTGKTYRITSSISINSRRFDGRTCTILKDFAGIGIQVSGGSSFSFLSDFTIRASTAQQATDYSGIEADHGISIVNTRVQVRHVSSNNHKGAGFLLNQTGPNMNRCQFEDIVAIGNSLAGVYMDGNFPTANDMSVWQFSGRFTGNYGYALLTTSTCPIRHVDMWIYAEGNLLGTAAPLDYAVKINRALGLTIWAYVENQKAGTSELLLGSNTSLCVVQSVRKNKDGDTGVNNLWIFGNITYNPGTSRNTIVQIFNDPFARLDRFGESVRIELSGNSAGTGNSTYGYLTGEGSPSSNPSIGFRDYLNNNQLKISPEGVRLFGRAFNTGSWLTGGTSTTTKPQLLIEPSGTTSTGWSTSGTGFGVNAASGFAGNLLDLQVNGTSTFSVQADGVINARIGITNVLFQQNIDNSTYVTAFTVPANSAWMVWCGFTRADSLVSVFSTFTVYRSTLGPVSHTAPVEVDSGLDNVRLQVSSNDVQCQRSANTGGGARQITVKAIRLH